MRIIVSIPPEVLEKADGVARLTGKSRSALFGAALREYVARHAADEVTEAMNRACERVSNHDGGFMNSAAQRILESSDW
jgi:metal-responsive CopG/Arc/MetJ family transcriptional regulator